MNAPVTQIVHTPMPKEVEKVKPEEKITVNSPLVGTFYRAKSPKDKPYVQVGDLVHVGDVICMVEAMKTMNEIPAPCDLVVEEILADNGALVSFDAPIIRYSHV